MCISILGLGSTPQCPFILIHNRDEYYSRIYERAAFWKEAPDVLGGRDVSSQGMWLGVSRLGRFGSITNYRDPSHFRPKAPSRGQIIRNYLMGQDFPTEPPLIDFNPFNLFFGSMRRPFFYSSREKRLQELRPGISGLSNASLETPWPKIQVAKDLFFKAVQSRPETPQILTSVLFKILENETQALEHELPQTGLRPEQEKALSSIFIKTPDYGTVSSAVILMTASNEVFFTERYFSPEGKQGEVTFEFKVEGPD